MKVTCFGDSWNTGHMLVTSLNHSDERLWQPFRQTLAWCQVVSQPFFILMSAARMRSPLFGMLAELAPHVGVKAESNIAQSFEDSRSIAAVKTLQHCCIKLDIQKGGSSEGSPTIVRTMRWWVLAVNREASRSLCFNMTLPLWNKWDSCHVDCRAGLATLAREHYMRMWQRGKNAAAGSYCWMYYYIVEWM